MCVLKELTWTRSSHSTTDTHTHTQKKLVMTDRIWKILYLMESWFLGLQELLFFQLKNEIRKINRDIDTKLYYWFPAVTKRWISISNGENELNLCCNFYILIDTYQNWLSEKKMKIRKVKKKEDDGKVSLRNLIWW